MSFVASRLPMPISSPRTNACPPSIHQPVSNETRVRADGLTKIIGSVWSVNGLYVTGFSPLDRSYRPSGPTRPGPPLRIGLIFFARSITSRNSALDKSSTWRKWRLPAGRLDLYANCAMLRMPARAMGLLRSERASERAMHVFGVMSRGISGGAQRRDPFYS